MRALVLWCPDWPVVAAVAAASTAGGPTGIEDADHIPVAVLSANRVVACSAAARAEGVRRGQRAFISHLAVSSSCLQGSRSTHEAFPFRFD